MAHFTNPVAGSLFEHYINIYIDLPKDYPIQLLGDLPIGWVIHAETISDYRLPILIISYAEIFAFEVVKTVEERVQEIIKEFEGYLGTRDIQATKSILTLMYS